MKERFSGPERGKEFLWPSQSLSKYYEGTIDLNNKKEVMGAAMELELEIEGKNIDESHVPLAEKLLVALEHFQKSSLDAGEKSIIDTQINTLTTFVEDYKKPTVQ